MIRTLVVEDDARVAAVHKAYVERLEGFAVAGVVHRATEAFEVLASRPVDLVLLDFGLPDLHGLELVRAVRARSRRPVDIVAVTAARDVDTVRAAVSQGVVQYLIKPFSFATFQDRLERYAEYRRGLTERPAAEQEDVDRLLGVLRGATAEALPKGIAQETYDLVTAFLRDAAEERSAQEVATATGLSRVTARRYLEHMAEAGLVTLSLRYGSTGRPEHRYRWNARRGAPAR